MASEQFLKLKARLELARPSGPVDYSARRTAMEALALPTPSDAIVSTRMVGPLSAERVSVAAVDSSNDSSIASDAALLYIHGGGFVMGSPATHRKLAADLSRTMKSAVVVVDYPLAPEAPFPAAIDALVDAYEALLAEYSPTRLAVAGDSAGGGLTLSLLIALRDRGLPQPAAAVLISPWVDLTFSSTVAPELSALDPIVSSADLRAMRDLYLGSADPAQALASPALADLRGLPPLLIHVGSAEVLLPDSEFLAARASAAGVDTELVVWPDMVHVWHVFAGRVPEATEAVEALGAFLRRTLRIP